MQFTISERAADESPTAILGANCTAYATVGSLTRIVGVMVDTVGSPTLIVGAMVERGEDDELPGEEVGPAVEGSYF